MSWLKTAAQVQRELGVPDDLVLCYGYTLERETLLMGFKNKCLQRVCFTRDPARLTSTPLPAFDDFELFEPDAFFSNVKRWYEDSICPELRRMFETAGRPLPITPGGKNYIWGRQKPEFTHDSTCCTFLGRWFGLATFTSVEGGRNYDLYYCDQAGRPTVIARYGNEGPEYSSGMPLAQHMPPLLEAKRRAEVRNLLKRPDAEPGKDHDSVQGPRLVPKKETDETETTPGA